MTNPTPAPQPSGFSLSPDPVWPTGDPTGIAYYSEWDIAFKKFDVAARRDQGRATAYAAELHLAAMTAPTQQTTAYSADTLAAIRYLADSINNLQGLDMSRIIRSRPTDLSLASVWVISPTGVVGLSAGQKLALADTLPADVVRGGTFALAVGTLPTGISLNASTGVLACATTYTPGVTLALEFEYREPDAVAPTPPAPVG